MSDTTPDGTTGAPETYSTFGYGGRSTPVGYMLFGGSVLVVSMFVMVMSTYDGSGYQPTLGGFLALIGALAGGAILLVGTIAAGVRLGLRSR